MTVARHLPPRQQHLAVELILIVMLVAALTVFGLWNMPNLITKVMASEMIYTSQSLRMDSLEHFALHGRWLPSGYADAPSPDSVQPQGRSDDLSALGREMQVQFPRIQAVVSGAARPTSSSLSGMRHGLVDDTIVTVARIKISDEPITWVMRPAVRRDSGLVVAWLCGTGNPAAAWAAPSVAPDTVSNVAQADWCNASSLR